MSRPAILPVIRSRPARLDRENRFEGGGLGAGLTRLTTFFHDGARGNLVRIGRGFRTRGLVIAVRGEGNRIEIGDDVRFSGRIGLRGEGLPSASATAPTPRPPASSRAGPMCGSAPIA